MVITSIIFLDKFASIVNFLFHLAEPKYKYQEKNKTENRKKNIKLLCLIV